MTSTQFTPGPWTRLPDAVQIGDSTFIQSSNIAYPIFHGDLNLIAAAPDMYAALLGVLSAFRRGDAMLIERIAALIDVEKALKLADGEA